MINALVNLRNNKSIQLGLPFIDIILNACRNGTETIYEWKAGHDLL